MSDAAPENTTTPPGTPAKNDFDRADFAEPAAAAVECAICKHPIVTEYWQYAGKILCAECRDRVAHTSAEARRGATFGKAFLVGGVVAFGCGLGYAIFVNVAKMQFAL